MTLPIDPSINPGTSQQAETSTSEAAEPVTKSVTTPSTVFAGIWLEGAGHTVADCTIRRIDGTGTFPQNYGVFLGGSPTAANTVHRCTIAQREASPGTGIHFSGRSGVYRDNTVHFFASPVVNGIDAGGNSLVST